MFQPLDELINFAGALSSEVWVFLNMQVHVKVSLWVITANIGRIIVWPTVLTPGFSIIWLQYWLTYPKTREYIICKPLLQWIFGFLWKLFYIASILSWIHFFIHSMYKLSCLKSLCDMSSCHLEDAVVLVCLLYLFKFQLLEKSCNEY